MADSEEIASSAASSLAEQWMSALRASTKMLEDFTRLGPRPALIPDDLKLPGAMSAAQMTALTDSIAAQRQSIEALKTQLSAFDEQLAVLEQILGPFAEWSRTWAEIEQRLLAVRPGGGSSAGDNG